MNRLLTTYAAAVGAVAIFNTANAGLLYEPDSYALQDNLVVNFDGIRNAGLLKAHDNNATKWKSIGRVPNDATLISKSGDTSAWVADGYHFAGGTLGKLRSNQDFGSQMTVQIVCDVRGSESSSTWPTFFGNSSDYANIYFSNKSTGLIHFKADYSTGGGSARADVTATHVTYLNAALDAPAHKSIIVTSDSFVNGWKTGAQTKTNLVATQTWTFGSAGTDQNGYNQRYLVGTIKAIRVYNRILTNEELTVNRALDEIRFFTGIPVTNIVVATSVAGVEGNESSGAYAIDAEGYTFSAPQKATKDGTVYSCTGYTLETWNGSSWSSPVSHASKSYTATDANAKVRLTWQWARAHAAVSTDLDPLFDDYVTDGLVFHLDGIRNVGADKPHDSSSSEWIDLAKGKVGSFQHDFEDASTWTEDGYYFGGRSFAQFEPALVGLTNTVTVQVVCDTTTNALAKFKTSRDPWVLWPNMVSLGDNDKLNIYYDMNRTTPYIPVFKSANGGNTYMPANIWEGRYVTAMRNGNKHYILQTTNIADAASVTHSQGNIATDILRVGGANSTLGDLKTKSRNSRWFLGTIKAIRIYDRVLTDAELAQNREIDEVRFFGAPLATGVVVASSVRGVNGNEPEGEYALPDGGHTFAAPTSVTVGEDTYSCTGYTLETWDGSTWGTPASSASLSCALTDTSAKYRLTWQWSHTAGPGYDAAFSDYVTDGLVVHLDGIRNAGLQAAHDSGAVTWADLSTKGGAAWLLNNSDATVSGSAVTTSGWKADGYYFNGASHAVMNGTRTLDGNYTVQAVLDFDPLASCREKYAQYPMIVGTTEQADKLSIYQNQYGRETPILACKALGNWPNFELTGWAGDYVTMLLNGTQLALFYTETPTEEKPFSSSPGTRTLTFGGSNGDTSSGAWSYRYLTSTIKAIRIYDRALSNEELSANRAADEVRFFGRAPAATGALIVTSDVEGLSGSQPNGAYRPAAGYAFTAPAEAIVEGTLYECAGYTLETWDGSAWSSAVTNDGMNAVAPDVSSASKRLTWNWRVASRLVKIKDYDVGDYAQTDLYLHFDGIRNAGKTAAHDNEATTWVNLGNGGTSFNATFDYEKSGATASSWADDGYNFTNGGKFVLIGGSPNLDNRVTIQVVCDGNVGGGKWPHLFGSTNDFCNVYSYTGSVAGDSLVFKVFNNRGDGNGLKAGGRVELTKIWAGKYASGIWQAGRISLFQTETAASATWAGKWDYNWAGFVGQPFYIGGVYFPASTSDTDNRRLAGKIHAVRVYKRSLTDAELEQNRIVDEARFFGNPPAAANLTVVNEQPEGASEAVQGSIEDGAYNLTGSQTVTADTVRINGKRFEPFYILETYADGVWTRTASGRGHSYNVTGGATPVRLTWRWQSVGTMISFR